MAPLIILVATFALIFAANKFVFGGRLSISQIGRYALALMMLIAGISHFTTTGIEVMTQMMPDVTPYKRELVYFTGVCELAAVPGLIFQRTSRLTAIMLIIFFLAVLPANIAGSLKQVNYSGMEYGALYLLFRVPLQLLFIWWAWYLVLIMFV
jgi:uncharacterized membrane protein